MPSTCMPPSSTSNAMKKSNNPSLLRRKHLLCAPNTFVATRWATKKHLANVKFEPRTVTEVNFRSYSPLQHNKKTAFCSREKSFFSSDQGVRCGGCCMEDARRFLFMQIRKKHPLIFFFFCSRNLRGEGLQERTKTRMRTSAVPLPASRHNSEYSNIY